MIASIGHSILSAVTHAAVGALKNEFQGVVSASRNGLADVVRGSDVDALEAGEGALGLPLIVIGVAAAASAVLFVPKWRNAALDFNDGALRKLGHRAQNWFETKTGGVPSATHATTTVINSEAN